MTFSSALLACCFLLGCFLIFLTLPWPFGMCFFVVVIVKVSFAGVEFSSSVVAYPLAVVCNVFLHFSLSVVWRKQVVAPVIERTALLELMTQMIAPALEAKVQLECFVQGAAQKNFLLIQVLC